VEWLVRLTQFSQADGLRYAIEANRRRQYQNSGSLPWQFNEPYPMAACTSAVDYFARPKPAYYAVARAYEPIHVSAKFPRQAWEGPAQFEAEVWVSNAHAQAFQNARLETRIVGLSGKVYDSRQSAASFLADVSTPLVELRWSLAGLEEDIFFLDLRLSQAENRWLSHNRYLFSRARDLALLLSAPPTRLEISEAKLDGRWNVTLKNTGPVTALFVWLEGGRNVDAPGYIYFDDNHFCLFPGEARTVIAEWRGVPPEERQVTVAGWNTQVSEPRRREERKEN
jgi:beta-mannosidase